MFILHNYHWNWFDFLTQLKSKTNWTDVKYYLRLWIQFNNDNNISVTISHVSCEILLSIEQVVNVQRNGTGIIPERSIRWQKFSWEHVLRRVVQVVCDFVGKYFAVGVFGHIPNDASGGERHVGERHVRWWAGSCSGKKTNITLKDHRNLFHVYLAMAFLDIWPYSSSKS